MSGSAYRKKHFIALVLISASALIASPAYAARLYIEVGAGLAQIRAAGTFFGNDAPSPLGLGAALNGTFGISLTPQSAPLSLQIGAQHRYSTGSDQKSSYSVQALYPVIRFESHRLFFTLGATPFAWKRIAANAGFDSINYSSSTWAGVGEMGYQWPITPAVSFVLSGAAELYRKTSGGLGPKPILETTAALRFFIDGPANFKQDVGVSEERDGPYEGWRYPFGQSR